MDGQTRTATTSSHDRCRHAVSTSLRLVDRVKTQTDGRTNGRMDGPKDRRRESNLVHLSLKMWHLVAII